VGVHQDGLVHISAMTDKFISDPREIVKAGDIVKVKVMEVDVARKRVSFTMRLNDTAPASAPSSQSKENTKKPMHNKTSAQHKAQTTANPLMGNAFAEAFAKAKKR